MLEVTGPSHPLEGPGARLLSEVLHKPEQEGATHPPLRDPRTTSSSKVARQQAPGAGAPALERREPSVDIEMPIRNVHRTVGTILGSESLASTASTGLPDDTITGPFTGSAGQSLGAFCSTRHSRSASRGRRQRLLRQGPVRAADHRARCRPEGVDLRSRREHHRRQRGPLRRHRRRGLLPGRRRASASACATAAPRRSSKASATTAAST